MYYFPFRSVMAALLLQCAATALAQQPTKAIAVVDAPYMRELTDDAESALTQKCTWELKVSSVLKPEGAFFYTAECLEDFRPDTAWVEGAAEQGVGQTLTYTLKAVSADAQGKHPILTSFALINGYARSRYIWEFNSRVRELRICLNGAPLCTAQLLDSMQPQLVKLDQTMLKPGDQLTFQIMSVYPGTKYKDTAIAEMRLRGVMK